MKIEIIFIRHFFCIGISYDSFNNYLSIMPFPMIAIVFKLPVKCYFIFDHNGNAFDITRYPDSVYSLYEVKEYWGKNIDDYTPIFKSNMKYFKQYQNYIR